MFINRAPHWLLGTFVVAVTAYFASVGFETVVDAFEPDLESWDELG
ncbi:MAG: thiazole synthase [Mycobacteriaceae bacterium]|nr:thiazole synthase [Mycobacteriaceae bacterium]